MNKKEQIKLLDQTVAGLSKMNLKDRHLALVALLAWHISIAPENIKDEVLASISKQTIELLNAAMKRVLDEAPDIRH